MVTPALSVYGIAIAVLMVSRLRTFSGKLIGRRIDREYIAPVVVVAALFAAVLATYPYLTLTTTCLIYLALIPVSIRQYREAEQSVVTPALSHDAGDVQPENPPRRLHS
jgi:CDP-diacylglycerol--serine O-phosphatidyltransferase